MRGRQWGGGRYHGVHLLGRGATSEVWRAEDLTGGPDVAVKSFSPAASSTHDTEGDRFRAEVGLLARLPHPNVVPVRDADVTADPPWYVMHLADGGSLARPAPGSLPVDVVRIATQIAAALEHVHGQGIVHRDLKPANILLDLDGHAYLSDFGIARGEGDTRLTRTGCIIGTAAYLSPEQVRGERVTPACDVYAFGLMLLELFTGCIEYPGSPVESAVARLNRSPAVPADLAAPWPALLRAMTAPEPDARPDAAELRRLLRRVPATTRQAEPEALVPRRTPPPMAPAAEARSGPAEHETRTVPGPRTPPGPRWSARCSWWRAVDRRGRRAGAGDMPPLLLDVAARRDGALRRRGHGPTRSGRGRRHPLRRRAGDRDPVAAARPGAPFDDAGHGDDPVDRPGGDPADGGGASRAPDDGSRCPGTRCSP